MHGGEICPEAACHRHLFREGLATAVAVGPVLVLTTFKLLGRVADSNVQVAWAGLP